MMTEAKIEQLIINSPYSEPLYHWVYNAEYKCFDKVTGRRSAGYFIAKPKAKDYDKEGVFVELGLVNMIRSRVKDWRTSGYPGITGTTSRLLEYWHDDSERHEQPFFFCQLDAIETLIFLSEAPDRMKTGIDIPGDSGHFRRLCTKLCTGGGKTVVMSMLIAWQVCNKVSYPRDKRFTKNILAVAPNLTVKKRLEVLKTGGETNYYDRFGVVPPELGDELRQGKVIVLNWQALYWENAEEIARRKSVDKRGPKSDNVYSREIVGDMRNILVINDEAHHAYRVKTDGKAKRSKEEKDAEREATIWIEGLDRIDRARNITACYDFSATPFVPGMRRNDEEALFSWIVSDYSLSDGIESGIVKTPRVVVRDDGTPDAKTNRSKFTHIYADPEVKASLNRSAARDEALPDLVRNAYGLLGQDWKMTFDAWNTAGKTTPPVMITVANRVETAARIENAFVSKSIDVPELSANMLRIDSGKLDDLKSSEAEELREKVDTVGQEGRPGEDVRSVISVGMLSEGWDARTVTHIMGLRAFSSQLLCEQVVGRGLRRTSYDRPENEDGLFSPEYVNVFGIPFSFMPHEGTEGIPGPEPSKTKIYVDPLRAEYAITWPNVSRLEYGIRQKLSLDVSKVPVLELDAVKLSAELAPVLDGKADTSRAGRIMIDGLQGRMQRVIFASVSRVYDEINAQWQKEGTKLGLIGQIISLTEEYLRYGNIITHGDKREIVIAVNIDKVIRHIWSFIASTSTESITAVLDTRKRERSTWEMPTWYTGRASDKTHKSHINRSVHDSTYEHSAAYRFDYNDNVRSWVKNDHLGFSVSYVFGGVTRRYLPDFIIKLTNGEMLILETKGIITEQDKEKFSALKEWCKGVNSLGEFGIWHCDMVSNPADVDAIILQHINKE